ncbi:Panacea domain-containing protein [Thiocapsa rosea]|uniref:Putative phage-associated protein n=1 Tax=Thiocapsa rosea TaxID=69360 RepID=A0A495VE16_9GAMM|nr:Panacea domain-containing protein [Thiocapsa rosea]RKT47504.1 putative phage-associated protein [Thiocapsa rosea]
MLITHEREKLINAIIYFAKNTRAPGKIKLFKLLYLLDFEHFRQTGRSVTGLEYRAWKFGPVPIRLMQEWEDLEPDLRAAIAIEPKRVYDFVRETVIPQAEFDDSHFSKRELRIMEELASIYRDELSPKMIDVTHAENGAWGKVWKDGAGNDRTIDYKLSLADDDPIRPAIMEAAYEYQAIAESAASR